MIIIFFKASILLSNLHSIHNFLQNHPGGKYLVWQGIVSATTFAFSLSFFYALYIFYICIVYTVAHLWGEAGWRVLYLTGCLTSRLVGGRGRAVVEGGGGGT